MLQVYKTRNNLVAQGFFLIQRVFDNFLILGVGPEQRGELGWEDAHGEGNGGGGY